MRGSTMTRSAYGLDGDGTAGWYRRGLCRGKNPDWWILERGKPDLNNRQALKLCAACPVRAACRDDMLRSDRPRSVIAGGWRWGAHGQVTPFKGDDPAQAVNRTVKPHLPAGRPGRRTPAPSTGKRFLAAGRARVDGRDRAAVALEFEMNPKTVDAASLVLRYAADMVPDVEAGRVAISAALSKARATRSAVLRGAP